MIKQNSLLGTLAAQIQLFSKVRGSNMAPGYLGKLCSKYRQIMEEIIAEAWDAFIYSKEGEAILCAFQAHFSGLLPCIYTENILHRRFAVQIRGGIMPSALRL